MVRRIEACLFACALLSVGGSASAFLIGGPQYTNIAEYTNDITGHYVLLNNGAEIQAVEAGLAGPGWRFTGYMFAERADDTTGEVDVCRFYTPSSNSHFFTANAAECDLLRKPGSGWIFEGIAFKALVPVDGQCAAGTVPIYRQYNNRAAFLDSNHRFNSDARVRARMLSAGWADEGVAFCAPFAGRENQRVVFTKSSSAVASVCESAPSFLETDCLEAPGLPPMLSSVDMSTTAEFPAVPNPDWSNDWDAQLGWIMGYGELSTFGSLAPASAVTRRSYLLHEQANRALFDTGELGIHLDGRDRTSGDLASFAIVHTFASLPPLAGAADARLMPWAGGRDRDLVLGFFARNLISVTRSQPQDQGYGTFGVRLRDTGSGKAIEVNVLAYGSVAPEDLVGADPRTGDVIVSTVFRAGSAFGLNEFASFVACDPSCGPAAPLPEFRLRINIEDVDAILQKARRVEPALSANRADYRVERFECRSETYRDAEIKAWIGACNLGVSF